MGSSPAIPRPGGASSCYLVRSAGAAVLLDVGGGSVGKLQLLFEYELLDAVVISHMHADHFVDLVPLRYALKYGRARRNGPLPLWLPPNGRAALEALRRAVSSDAPADFFDYVYAVREYDPAQPLIIDDLELTFRRTRHYIDAYAVRAASRQTAIAYSADTAPSQEIIEHARGASLFLCEAALGLETESGERGHSTAREAGEMARAAGVARLVLTHYPANYPAAELVAAAAETFEGAIDAAEDGSSFAT